MQAIRHFLNCEANAASIDSAVIAAAGPVSGGRCKLTNADWTLVSDELKSTFGLSTVDIVNDLEALAWSVPRLASGDWVSVGRGLPVDAEPIAIVAPGTGLGMACLNKLDRFHLVADVIDRVPGLRVRAAYAKQAIRDKLIDHRAYISRHGDDMPDIIGWRWGQAESSPGIRSTEADNL